MAHDNDASLADPAANLARVREKLNVALCEAGRAPGDARLVAVSKTQPPETIRRALEAGHRVFGENRLQEAAEKWPPLKSAYREVELHLIGPLQSNKAGAAVALFDVIQSVDREKIARALATEIQSQGRAPRLLVQVNTGEEPQKAGVAPPDADAFIAACREDFRLDIEGLMCIPPADEGPAAHFALLEKIARRNNLQTLSMGMSADYEIAAQLGATLVRVGTEIFGPRVSVR